MVSTQAKLVLESPHFFLRREGTVIVRPLQTPHTVGGKLYSGFIDINRRDHVYIWFRILIGGSVRRLLHVAIAAGANKAGAKAGHGSRTGRFRPTAAGSLRRQSVNMLDGERHRSTDLVCSQLAIRSVSFAASRSAEEQRSTFMLCKMLLELTPGLEVARTEVALSVVSLEMLSFGGWTLGFRYPRELLD